ncbi:MAG: hypothetical protein ACTHLW_13020 [Verrucomicrobiota bacterium]
MSEFVRCGADFCGNGVEHNFKNDTAAAGVNPMVLQIEERRRFQKNFPCSQRATSVFGSICYGQTLQTFHAQAFA